MTSGDLADVREARADLLHRLGRSVDAVADEICYGLDFEGGAYSSALRKTVRSVADLFVRTAMSDAPAQDIIVRRLRQLNATRGCDGVDCNNVSRLVFTGSRAVLDALVREVGPPGEGIDVATVEAVGAITMDLGNFAKTLLWFLKAGYSAEPDARREVVGPSGQFKRRLISPLPRDALESVGPRRDTSPPYALVVAAPLSQRGARRLSDSLAELAKAVGSLVEGATFEHPIPHAAALASNVEPWRQSELIAATAGLAASEELLIVYSPPAQTTGELEQYYRIVRDNLTLAVRAYRSDFRALPLAALAFDALLMTIPTHQQFDFIRRLFGLGLALAPERSRVLVDTVRAIVAAGGSGAAPARELSMHRHGVSYRRRRIQTLKGHDPADPANRPAFFAALRMLELCHDRLPALGSDQWRDN
jgi:hypothetical protein